ncbi:MAG: metallophosphoesterase [Ruminococcus sp.]|uniref:metallophosphoesterase family protein n=1 Tax=Ruminococcus sp. TaxID=41978 RepID=UPI0025CDDA57|nr:metallophosphoesterase [Ruminococcus sp.]MCR5540686.1 metallophosphoesterase [Ruminococcus sp.]
MVRIALISDIHFGKFSRSVELSVPGEPIKDESIGAESIIESAISVLKEQDITYICVAGDLTSIGSPQEFKYCNDMLNNIAYKLNISQKNIFIGLGNHDIDWKISELYDQYDSSYSEFPIEFVKEQYRIIAANASIHNLTTTFPTEDKGPAPYSGIIENDDFILFVLNTGWCCTKDQRFSHGKLDTSQLQWFSDKAKKYKGSKKWKLILLHHHPLAYKYNVPAWDPSLLEESGELLEIAGSNGFNVIMHGHRHHPRAQTMFDGAWENPISFVCAGSFAVNASHRYGGSIPNTIHVVELGDEVGVLKLKTFQYSPASGWIPLVKNCEETPLDYEMRLGKIFDYEKIKESILSLKQRDSEIKWDSLDECLYYMPINVLNEKMKEYLEDTHRIIGRFPDSIVLIKK